MAEEHLPSSTTHDFSQPQLPELTSKPGKDALTSDLLGATSVPSTAKLVVASVLAGVVVLAISVVLDFLLLVGHESTRTLVELSDLFAATLIATLFFIYGRIRQQQLLQRMQIIAEMNHHIRNALQVIASSSYMGDRDKELAVLRDAVKRVDWALREILPKL